MHVLSRQITSQISICVSDTQLLALLAFWLACHTQQGGSYIIQNMDKMNSRLKFIFI